MAPEHGLRRYQLGPRSTRGLVAGWRSGQIACVCAGLLLAVGLMRAVGGAAGAVLAFLAAGGGIAAATWRLAGRTPEQWAPIAAGFGARACAEARHRPWLTNRGRPRGPLSRFALLHLPEPGNWEPAWRESLEDFAQRMRKDRPGSSPIDLPTLPATGVGVIDDSELATWTAVVPAGGTGFALLGEAERIERIAAWSGVLAAVARDATGLHRLQWLSSAQPAWLDGGVPVGADGSPPGRHYRQFFREASASLWNHDVYIGLTVSRRGGRGGSDAASVLREQLASLHDRIDGAGLDAGEALSPLRLANLVRRSFEAAPAHAATAWPWPWPVAVDAAWSCLRTDTSWHATYWVAEWPRCEVGGGFLLPLLLEHQLRRVVSLTMAPVSAASAVRRAERERTEGTADAELRRRHGFAVTARALKEQASRQQREEELAAGHAGYRYSAYVTLTEADRGSLERACGRLEQAAALAQLELRRLYGAQEEAYCCTLPAGRGCP